MGITWLAWVLGFCVSCFRVVVLVAGCLNCFEVVVFVICCFLLLNDWLCWLGWLVLVTFWFMVVIDLVCGLVGWCRAA